MSGNDLLLWWRHDEHTSAVVLYLESFGNPRKFARLARRLTRTKPVLAVRAAAAGGGQGRRGRGAAQGSAARTPT